MLIPQNATSVLANGGHLSARTRRCEILAFLDEATLQSWVDELLWPPGPHDGNQGAVGALHIRLDDPLGLFRLESALVTRSVVDLFGFQGWAVCFGIDFGRTIAAATLDAFASSSPAAGEAIDYRCAVALAERWSQELEMFERRRSAQDEPIQAPFDLSADDKNVPLDEHAGRVMAAAGLYAPSIAEVALRHCAGDPDRATVLLRAYRGSLPILAETPPIAASDVRCVCDGETRTATIRIPLVHPGTGEPVFLGSVSTPLDSLPMVRVRTSADASSTLKL
jgi:Bacterial phosphonate metabolism protein (PhnI)